MAIIKLILSKFEIYNPVLQQVQHLIVYDKISDNELGPWTFLSTEMSPTIKKTKIAILGIPGQDAVRWRKFVLFFVRRVAKPDRMTNLAHCVF